jgi:hypothetical protein
LESSSTRGVTQPELEAETEGTIDEDTFQFVVE